MPSVGKLQLVSGTFYRARNGQTWCCFRARPLVKDYGVHAQAMCIRVTDYKVNYYLDDHSFDDGGEVDEDDVLFEPVSEEEVTREWIAEWEEHQKTQAEWEEERRKMLLRL